MTRDDLERMRVWADSKLATGAEPPWAWYQYMKLWETLGSILDGMAATQPMESSPEAVPHPEKPLRLVVSTRPQGTAPRRRADEPVQLPL